MKTPVSPHFRRFPGREEGQDNAAEKEHAEHREELRAADPLLALLPMVPGQDQREQEADQEENMDGPLKSRGDSPRLRQHLHRLKHHEGARQVRECPLDQLAVPEALEKRG